VLQAVSGFRGISLLVAVVVALAILYPLVGAFVRGLFPGGSFASSAVVQLLTDPGFGTAVLNTVVLIVVSGAIALVIGGVFAWLMTRTDARLGFVSTLLPVAPLFLPPVALSIGWLFLAHQSAGLINILLRSALNLVGIHLSEGPIDITSWGGLVFVYTLYFVPLVYVTVSAALQRVDSSLEEASRTSGGGIWRTVRLITFPGIRPALVSSALLILIDGIGQFSFPRTLGIPANIQTVSVYLVRLVQEYPPKDDQAIVLGVLIVAAVAPAFFVQLRLVRDARFVALTGKTGSSALIRLGGWRWAARVVVAVYLALASLLPLLALILVALQPYWSPNIAWSSLSMENFLRYLQPPSPTVTALLNSFGLAAAAATIATAVAAILAVGARDARGRGGILFAQIPRLPGAFSHVVLGIALLIAFSSAPFRLYGTLWILLIAYVILVLPQASISAASALSQVGSPLTDAAAMSGSSRGRTFLHVTLPLMMPGLVGGWALLFVITIGDLTASAILSGTTNPVVGLVIISVYDSGTYSQLAALATIVALVSAIVVSMVLWRGRPRRTARTMMRSGNEPA
jgi:iron(III) transport system permease protein